MGNYTSLMDAQGGQEVLVGGRGPSTEIVVAGRITQGRGDVAELMNELRRNLLPVRGSEARFLNSKLSFHSFA